MKTLLASALLAACALPCCAQEVSSSPVPSPRSAEPVVQHTVIEDQGSRIEELRVRGTTQRITVTPKVGTRKGYEIIQPDGGRDLSESAGSSRGAAGKRVWNVMSF